MHQSAPDDGLLPKDRLAMVDTSGEPLNGKSLAKSLGRPAAKRNVFTCVYFISLVSDSQPSSVVAPADQESARYVLSEGAPATETGLARFPEKRPLRKWCRGS